MPRSMQSVAGTGAKRSRRRAVPAGLICPEGLVLLETMWTCLFKRDYAWKMMSLIFYRPALAFYVGKYV